MLTDLGPVIGHHTRMMKPPGASLTIAKYIFQFLYRTADGCAPE